MVKFKIHIFNLVTPNLEFSEVTWKNVMTAFCTISPGIRFESGVVRICNSGVGILKTLSAALLAFLAYIQTFLNCVKRFFVR